MFDNNRPQKTTALRRVRWGDEARFIRTWLENPSATGAVSPSSRALSRAMARYVDPSTPGPVIELGPGTGPVTDALLRRGVAPERLVLVEYEAAFCRLLARRYPRCQVIQGDAYALGDTLREQLSAPAAAVVSSLPLLNRPEWQRFHLLMEAFELLRPGAPFIQFTYGLLSPVPRHDGLSPVLFDATVSAPVWLNLPPARVWVYRPAASTDQAILQRKRDLIDRFKAGREKLGDEWRDGREKLRAEFRVRSSEAKAELRARTERVRTGFEKHSARVKAARAERLADKRHHW